MLSCREEKREKQEHDTMSLAQAAVSASEELGRKPGLYLEQEASRLSSSSWAQLDLPTAHTGVCAGLALTLPSKAPFLPPVKESPLV